MSGPLFEPNVEPIFLYSERYFFMLLGGFTDNIVETKRISIV